MYECRFGYLYVYSNLYCPCCMNEAMNARTSRIVPSPLLRRDARSESRES